MKNVDAGEVERRFDDLLAEVENGETVVVTRNGVPVARMIPYNETFDTVSLGTDAEHAAAAIEELRRLRDEHHFTLGEGLTIRDLIEEGRRY